MMEKIYKNVLLLIHSLTRLSGICYKISKEPTDETGAKLIEIVDNCEKKFLKVKEEIVKMVQDIEDKSVPNRPQSINGTKESEISAIKTESGFLVKEQ